MVDYEDEYATEWVGGSSMSQAGRKVAIPVTGMSCAACSARVEKALSRTEGVSAASVNLATGKATVEYDLDTVGATELVQTIEEAGYVAATERTDFEVIGMTCASCAGHVEKALRAVPCVLNVNLAAEKASVEHLPGEA